MKAAGWPWIAMAMEEFPWEFHIYLIDGEDFLST
jgi:hypothetical protein